MSHSNQNQQALRMKTLSVIAEDVVQKIGHIEIDLGEFGSGDLGGIRLEDLEDIEFKFEQIGDPVFNVRVLENKVINCGFIQFTAAAINIPANIRSDFANRLRNIFGLASGETPEIISIPLQGAIDVCGVRSDDDIEEFFDVEGIAVCFVLKTVLSGSTDLVTRLVLVIKAAVKVRIVVSRFKLVTADVSDVEDVTDFECEEVEDP